MPRRPPATTGELLLRAVHEHPEDDAPRLAYADWLDESDGEPERAALIRVQCELARLTQNDPRAVDLRQREERLLRDPTRRWRAHLPKFRSVVWGDFSRGFVDSVVLKSTYQFWRYSARIAEAIPLRSVAVRPANDYPREMTGFGRMRALARVSELHLPKQLMDDGRFSQLLASPYLAKLAHLNVADNQIGDQGVAALIATTLPALRVVNLSGNQVSIEGARFLAESSLVQRLEFLDLSRNGLTSSGDDTARAAFGTRINM